MATGNTLSKKDSRTRNWCFVVYPESAPADWRDRLERLAVPALISPLHDRDVNPDGVIKKSHYHVMLMHKGKKSFEQIKSITDSLNSPMPIPVSDSRGMARYFCHIDNPEKYQYDIDDVKSIGGVDYRSIIGLASDKYAAIREMAHFCIENGIMEYCVLFEYAMDNNEGWFRVLCDSSFAIQQFLKSTRYNRMNAQNDALDE